MSRSRFPRAEVLRMEGRAPANETEARRLEALRVAMAPIIPLLDDPAVIEIALNADGTLWAERMGEPMVCTGARMSNADAFRMLQLVANAVSTEITPGRPSLAALIPGWESRLQAMIPPIVRAPVFTIRKPPQKVFTLDSYVERGIMSCGQADVIRQTVLARGNILVGGSTGAGKTTLANAILHEIGAATCDRLYIIEDMRELQCTAANRVEVFVQEPLHGWQRAIMDALRSRPDRIVVGEVRSGGAALELVKAWNTGHPGGLATIHANDTGAMLDRLCQLMEEVIPKAPRVFVAETIDLCIHVARDLQQPGGRRLSGMDRVRGVGADGRWALEPMG
jgi:type IV secretion system protein TrbB